MHLQGLPGGYIWAWKARASGSFKGSSTGKRIQLECRISDTTISAP